MEIKLQKRVTKYLLPMTSALALAAATGLFIVNLSSSPETRAVLIATRDLPEGELLHESDVRITQIPIGNLAENYQSEFEPNLFLERSVTQGELLSKRYFTDTATARIPVRLNDLKPIAKSISVGDRVDIWAIERSQVGASEPQPVAFDAIVTLIEANNSMAQNLTNLEIRIGEEYLESLLLATGSNFQLSVILHETLADLE
jgi:Flp pilus assembly protein CpaB